MKTTTCDFCKKQINYPYQFGDFEAALLKTGVILCDFCKKQINYPYQFGDTLFVDVPAPSGLLRFLYRTQLRNCETELDICITCFKEKLIEALTSEQTPKEK